VPGRTSQLEAGLTRREVQVAQLVVDGLGNRQIADRLGVSPRTVHAHLSNAMDKTGTQTRTQLAVFALRSGLALLPGGPGDDAG
jgi:DNA-binding NarL/FixJ family response regulator